jgi:hypothetical protein
MSNISSKTGLLRINLPLERIFPTSEQAWQVLKSAAQCHEEPACPPSAPSAVSEVRS